MSHPIDYPISQKLSLFCVAMGSVATTSLHWLHLFCMCSLLDLLTLLYLMMVSLLTNKNYPMVFLTYKSTSCLQSISVVPCRYDPANYFSNPLTPPPLPNSGNIDSANQTFLAPSSGPTSISMAQSNQAFVAAATAGWNKHEYFHCVD